MTNGLCFKLCDVILSEGSGEPMPFAALSSHQDPLAFITPSSAPRGGTEHMCLFVHILMMGSTLVHSPAVQPKPPQKRKCLSDLFTFLWEESCAIVKAVGRVNFVDFAKITA